MRIRVGSDKSFSDLIIDDMVIWVHKRINVSRFIDITNSTYEQAIHFFF